MYTTVHSPESMSGTMIESPCPKCVKLPEVFAQAIDSVNAASLAVATESPATESAGTDCKEAAARAAWDADEAWWCSRTREKPFEWSAADSNDRARYAAIANAVIAVERARVVARIREVAELPELRGEPDTRVVLRGLASEIEGGE